MLTVEKPSRRPGTFRRLTGADANIFYETAEQIRPLWEDHRNNFGEGGREHSLRGHENHLLAMLLYYRCYVTCEFLSWFSDCRETAVIRSVRRIEKIAVQAVHIEKKREITRGEAGWPISDVTEQPVQRPEKGQKEYHSGKKKHHTVKTQYVTDPGGKICSVSRTYPGKTHDFSIYKDQKNRDRFHGVPEKADSGYRGIRKYDINAEIPFKKRKNGKLTDGQRTYNHKLSEKRIKVENVIRETKIFNILSDIYRNRRRGHGIKADITAGIVNMKTEKRIMKEAA